VNNRLYSLGGLFPRYLFGAYHSFFYAQVLSVLNGLKGRHKTKTYMPAFQASTVYLLCSQALRSQALRSGLSNIGLTGHLKTPRPLFFQIKKQTHVLRSIKCDHANKTPLCSQRSLKVKFALKNAPKALVT